MNKNFVVFFILAALCQNIVAIDNGLGMLPPMGWRSWNCWGKHVTQEKMQSAMDGMVKKYNGTSLLDVGFTDCGLDDNWQACGTGVDNSFHNASGYPLVNLATFPSLKNMTDHAHSVGLTAGWYGNNCICRENYIAKNETEAIDAHYQGDVDATVEFGFDATKLDGCGQFKDLPLFASKFNATGKAVLIENCHWGGTVPADRNVSNCQYNYYRTSGDIRNNWNSMMKNLKTTLKFSDESSAPSRNYPGCWAYPDMLEVGRMPSFNEDRTHFGAWVITSSPLILGHDVTDDATNEKIFPIVTNKEAIEVSQTWVGHPGTMIREEDLYQVWAKPVKNDGVAVLVIASGANSTIADFTFEEIGLDATSATVRDVWNLKDLGSAKSTFSTPSLDSHDSAFYVLTPASSKQE